MISALALGSGAAVLWAGGSLLSAPASRVAGTATAFLWTSATGAAVALVLAMLTGLPSGSGSDWALVVLAGVTYAGGTALWILGVNAGRVSVVVPIIACDGAIAAVLAALTGSTLPLVVALALACMVLGILLVTAGGPQDPDERLPFATRAMRPLPQTILIAAGSAVFFGVVFFASGRATGMEPLWIVAISRTIPVLVALPLCVAVGRVLPPARAWRFIVPYGVLDALGYILYVVGSGDGLAVASVAASQYAALAALGAVVVFKERLLKPQIAGLGVLVVSVAVIGAYA
jgi:drug/metabolite transporter (DMT)-like permease